MKKNLIAFMLFTLILQLAQSAYAQERRPIDSKHPLWLVHVDVWNKADPQKIIDQIPDDVKPYVCMNLSLSCQYDTDKNVYKMPQNAVRTFKSWATICQNNGLWFTCQPASGGHTHIQDNDLETFEYFFKKYPNFLGWNYAEQFWGFDAPNDKSSSSQASRITLFSKLVPMAHKYGGFLTISFCGNIWSHPLNPVGMMKRNSDLLAACEQYPEAILWLYKYTTSSCFYNNESVTFSPFISGLAKNYGVRYDNCGWNGAKDAILGDNNGKTYPVSAGIGTVMEQTGVNGGAVWDGPELIWTEDFKNLNDTYVNGYKRRNWTTFPGFRNIWTDMFKKVIDGSLYIPTRAEVVGNTKIAIVNDISSGSDEDMYAAWGDLYDGLYKQDDPFNKGTGQWMDNMCYFKKTGRYATIPIALNLYDDVAKSIPVQINKSTYASRWTSNDAKVAEFNSQYPEVSKGDLYVSRYKNQLVTYTPYTYFNSRISASARIPLKYNTCDSLKLNYGKLSSGLIKEYADHIDLYLNNFRTDTTTSVSDVVTVTGATVKPSYTLSKRVDAYAVANESWNSVDGTYTLDISHMGPVDLSIKCSGNAINRSSDVVSSTALSADLPKQPSDYSGDIIAEAEDMDYKDIKSCVLDPYGAYPNERGNAGNGFVDMGTSTTGSLRHVVNVKRAGSYNVTVRYTADGADGRLSAAMNTTTKALSCPQTATNEWKKVSFTADMNQGDNTLVLTNAGGTEMYIDQVIYTPADQSAEKFAVTVRDVEHGKVLADVSSAEEGSMVKLTVVPDEGYSLTAIDLIHGDVTINSDNSFIMPDDNVTLLPTFKDLSSVYKMDMTRTLSGTLPDGWRSVQESSTVHEFPNSYSSGSRTMTGFSGYQGKGLYWRNDCAEYGKQTGYLLTLKPGDYKLVFAMAAWKDAPSYKAQIINSNGTTIATSSVYTAAPNAAGSSLADISSATQNELAFTVTTTGNYVINFSDATSAGGFHEFLLLECNLMQTDLTGINQIKTVSTQHPVSIYNMSGMKQNAIATGVNIIRQSDGKTVKIVKK